MQKVLRDLEPQTISLTQRTQTLTIQKIKQKEKVASLRKKLGAQILIVQKSGPSNLEKF